MNAASRLLDEERAFEADFAARELALDREPRGWPAALLFFHVARWRERLRAGLADLRDGRRHAGPLSDIDEINDRELPQGKGLALEQTSALAAATLSALIDLSEQLGDRSFDWTLTTTAGGALIRNSYIHPRVHIATYLRENGELDRMQLLVEQTAAAVREAAAAPVILGAALYNLAAVRVMQARNAEAIGLLQEAAPMRPDLAAAATGDADLAPLRDDPRFKALAAADG